MSGVNLSWRVALLVLLVAGMADAAERLELSADDRAWIAAHPVVRLQMADNSPPFEFREQGIWRGLAYDHLVAACRLLGIKVEVQDITWNEALADIGTNQHIDLLLAVTRSSERERQMVLTRGYLAFPQVIVADRNRTFISGPSDLQHATVAVERGYVMEEWLRRDLPSATVIQTENSLSALKLVSSGRATAYVGNLAVATYLIDHAGLVNIGVVAPSAYDDEEFSVGVRRDWPQLASLLDRAFAALPLDERQGIRQRWLAVRYDYGLRTWDIAFWVLVVAGIALLFVVQLRRMVAARTQDLANEVALRRRREEQLAEAQRIAHLGSWVRDFARQEVDGSAEFGAILGRSTDQPLSVASWLDAVHPDDRHRLQAALDGEAEGRAVIDIEYRLRCPNGDLRQVLHRSTVLCDSQQRPIRSQGIILDITERTQLEEQLRRVQRMESLGQLSGSVAHDFNNVLTSIQGFADLIMMKISDPKLRKFAEHIVDAVAQAMTLTNRLLSFARQGSRNREAFDVHAALTTVLELFEATRSTRIEVVTALVARHPTITGSRGQLQSAVLNLCINAKDAMSNGGRLGVATSDERIDEVTSFAPYVIAPGRFLRIAISDSGSGMDSAVLARCLEPLFTTKGERGTGLGLPSVHACVIDHRGALRIESAPGQGTTVTVWLPVAHD